MLCLSMIFSSVIIRYQHFNYSQIAYLRILGFITAFSLSPSIFDGICVPSLVLSYGVFLVHSVELEVPTWINFRTPAIFILSYSLSQCWCREAADSWGGSRGYRVMAGIGLALVVISLLLCAFTSYWYHPYIYGILGGLGSSAISAQVDAVIFDTYDTRLGLVRGICFAGQAIGQSIFPYIITALIEYYGYSSSYIVLAGIMLQSLPTIMLLKVDESIRINNSFIRHSVLGQTYAKFGFDELNGYELQMHDSNKKCWKSPSDDNLKWDDESKGDNATFVTITPPSSPEEKRRNIFGVEILPEIPEESESEDEEEEEEKNTNDLNRNKKRLSKHIKRMSILSENLEGYIIKQTRKDSQTRNDMKETQQFSEIEVIYDNISPITNIQREKIFNTFSFRCQSTYANMKRKVLMPSYKIHRLKRRLIYWMYNINDTIIKPLTMSLSCWRFYPALILVFAKLSITAVNLVLLPMIASRLQPRMSSTDSNLLLSLHGFTWICFLLATPWLAHTPKRNYKYVTISGLLFSSGACFVLAEANTHNSFSMGCVIGGFGYGALSSCWETSIQEFVGVRKWPKIHSTLETVSGTLLTLVVVGLSFLLDREDGLHCCMFISGIILSVISFVWFTIAIVAVLTSKSDRNRLRWT